MLFVVVVVMTTLRESPPRPSKFHTACFSTLPVYTHGRRRLRVLIVCELLTARTDMAFSLDLQLQEFQRLQTCLFSQPNPLPIICFCFSKETAVPLFV